MDDIVAVFDYEDGNWLGFKGSREALGAALTSALLTGNPSGSPLKAVFVGVEAPPRWPYLEGAGVDEAVVQDTSVPLPDLVFCVVMVGGSILKIKAWNYDLTDKYEFYDRDNDCVATVEAADVYAVVLESAFEGFRFNKL